jgi:hypothetical protein
MPKTAILADHECHISLTNNFSGRAGFSTMIKLLTNSEYSHVGILLNDKSILLGEMVLLIESTTEIQLSDADGRQAIKGVQLHFLSQRLSMYDGSAFWVPLKNPIPQAQLDQMLTWARNIYAEKVPYPYTQVCGLPLLKIEDACGMETRPDYDAFFCSELVTKALQVAGVLDSFVDPASQTPSDIVNFSCFEKPVQIKGDS